MKVIKRDGRAVDYDKQKIEIAIEKANNEVRPCQRASKEEIQEIISYIEELDKKRMLVEDIQDVIEEKLMEIKKYKLAKKYIVYRYTRTLVRKQNTTDESILGIIKNQNNMQKKDLSKNAILASNQRDYIAGEVSKDLTKRILLPEKITKAHEEGILYFHDADFFLQPIFNCCLVNIKDMLENGTVVNGKLIETPKSFLVACTVVTQIISAVAMEQYGGQTIDLKHLGKYLRKSKEKFTKELQENYKEKLPQEIINSLVENRTKEEIRTGIQTLIYQINTLITSKTKPAEVTLLLNLEENDEYIQENALIIEEILKQKYEGIKDEDGNYRIPEFPNLVYILYENNNLNGNKYDYITNQIINYSKKGLKISFISAKKMRENYEGNVSGPIGKYGFLCPWKNETGQYQFEGRFNQGIVTINLPQIAIIADKDEKKFWSLLDERLELCYEALMCRHYALLGTKSDTSPIHWKYGGISRLETGETIDKLLKNGYSTISLGYIGIYETTKLIKGVSNSSNEGEKFALKVMNHLKQTIEKWKKETGIGFMLYGVQSESLSCRFAKIDKEKFGSLEDVTDKGYYTNSYEIDSREEVDTFTKLKYESKFQKISLGGAISHIKIENKTEEEIKEIIKFIYEFLQYAELNNN